MKKKLFLIFLFSATLFVWCNRCYCVEDKVVAIVNDEVITKAELDTNIKLLKLQIGEEGWRQNQMSEKKALQTLIEDRLVIQEAKKNGLKIEDRLIESRIKRIKSGFSDEEEFLIALSQQGLSLSELKERIKEQILSEELISNEIRRKIFISPKEVTEYYQTHMEEFYFPESVEIESIFVKEKKLSEEIYAKLKSGDSFKSLQEQYSQKNSVGSVSRGELRKDIEDVIFNLRIGEFSKSVEVNDDGYFIFLIRNKYPKQERKLIEVQNKVYDILSQIQFETRLKKFLDELKNKAYIIIKDG